MEHTDTTKSIREMMSEMDKLCSGLWKLTNKSCSFREQGSEERYVFCRFEGRLNYTCRDNCTYNLCPLVHGM